MQVSLREWSALLKDVAYSVTFYSHTCTDSVPKSVPRALLSPFTKTGGSEQRISLSRIFLRANQFSSPECDFCEFFTGDCDRMAAMRLASQLFVRHQTLEPLTAAEFHKPEAFDTSTSEFILKLLLMPALCFTPGVTAPLGLRQGSVRHLCPFVRSRPATSRRSPILCAKDSAGQNPRDRPLPQGFGKSVPSSGEQLAFVGANKIGISFTCDAAGCGERVTKSVNRRSYEKGTVLIQCPSCKKHHVIADNMGMYAPLTGGKKNIEEIAKDEGVAFTRVNAEAFRLDNTYRK